MIDDYRFGWIVVDAKKYTHDLIIYPDEIDAGWWREQGHSLQKKDLQDVFEFAPEVLVVGTGAGGRMRVPEETVKSIESQGIRLILQDTKKACESYNQLLDGKNVVAALHLTC